MAFLSPGLRNLVFSGLLFGTVVILIGILPRGGSGLWGACFLCSEHFEFSRVWGSFLAFRVLQRLGGRAGDFGELFWTGLSLGGGRDGADRGSEVLLI